METAWHTLSSEEVLKELHSSPEGLAAKEAEKRLQQEGANVLKTQKGPSFLALLGRQFLSPLVYVLVFAALVKLSVGSLLDGSVLTLTILLMVLIGFYQEARAEQAMQALKDLAVPRCRVRRGGKAQKIEAKDVVPGDILLLEAGDRIPADARVIEAKFCKTEEAALTGESQPVEKQKDPLSEKTSLAERTNMLYMGTAVSAGKAAAVVVAAGMNTEIGKIAEAIEGIETSKTPLQKSIHALGLWMIFIVAAAILLFIGISFWQGISWLDLFMLAVSAAVAAIPEGLPAAVTVVLAAGMTRMAKRHAMIRKMMAVETLGSTTVICSDKTGTLTLNQMSVKRIFTSEEWVDLKEGEFSQEGRAIKPLDSQALKTVLEIGMLCNDAIFSNEGTREQSVLGDPMEAALLEAGKEAGLDKEKLEKEKKRVDEIPFSSENRYMATLHEMDKERWAFVKGSPEKLLEMSSSFLSKEGEKPLNEEKKEKFLKSAEEAAQNALRLLGACIKKLPEGETFNENFLSSDLVFAGFFALIDPPRKEAASAIQHCKEAGIRVMMATGDNKATALAIAKEIGIETEAAIEGKELDEEKLSAWQEKVKKISVFARIEPLHKLKIVEALQNLGHVVAMTGDGVNDAPALEKADIGVAMGITGTPVAKEASDMVLTDDNFSSIVAAVEEGRAIFNRLRNVTTFLLSTCFGELFALTACVIAFGVSPLIPLQILWINLATGVIVAIPLGLEPKTGDELKQKPRNPQVGLIYPGMVLRIASLAFLLGASAFFLFSMSYHSKQIDHARELVFTSIVSFEWLIALTLRSDQASPFELGMFRNRPLMLSLGAAIFLHLVVLYVPFFQAPFRTSGLSLAEWGLVLLPGLSILLLDTFGKKILPRFFSLGKYEPLKKPFLLWAWSKIR